MKEAGIYVAKKDVVAGMFGQLRVAKGEKVKLEDVAPDTVGVLYPHDSTYESNESDYGSMTREDFLDSFESAE